MVASSAVYAKGFTNKDFLILPETQQKFWIQGAMYMLIHIGAAKSQEKGQCVADWYFGEKRPQRNSLILGSMEKYSSSYPSVVMLALVERECGLIRKPG